MVHKMKMSGNSFFLAIELIICLAMYKLKLYSFNTVCITSILTVVLVIWNIIRVDQKRFMFSSALIIYTLATQFGLVIPYFRFGRDILDQYHDYTLSFLNYDLLGKAILLGNIAVLTFEFMKCLANKRYPYIYREEKQQYNNDGKKSYMVGVLLLLVVVGYFLYHILFSNLSLISTYEKFMNSSAYNSWLYSYILILFYVGSIYLAAAGKIKDHKLGWFLWGILVLIFALNGNKGEFMYALLAILGLKGVQGQKITFKILALAGIVLFLIIPSITSLRNIGIIENLSSIHIDFVDAFAEMGMQIRTSVYVLDDLQNGTYTFLYGKSYYQPIINMVTPFLDHITATNHIRLMYRGYGFNQVIEGYLNFGILGVMGYFGIVGYLLAKWENTITNKMRLAYIGTITCILINATRNYFAFVPGQIVIVSIIYLVENMKKNQSIGREMY